MAHLSPLVPFFNRCAIMYTDAPGGIADYLLCYNKLHAGPTAQLEDELQLTNMLVLGIL
jgi:hypothetical protein